MTLFKKFSVVAVSAAVLAGSFLQAEAIPVPAAPAASTAAKAPGVTEVQYRHWHGGGYRGGWGGGRRGWYGGYRGYDYYRPGYRHYNGYWFPLAAFGAGALIGGAVASQPRYVEPVYPAYPAYRSAGLNPAHYQYCSARYRSYDPGSNTFQPYNGPRQQCYSPYY